MRYRWVAVMAAGIFSVGRIGAAQTLQAGFVSSGMTGNAFEMSAWEEAQAFQSDHDFTMTSVVMWTTFQNGSDPGPYDNGFRGVFDWALYGDDGGSPGGTIASGSIVPTMLSQQTFSPGFNLTQWRLDLPDLALDGNTQYWLGLHDTDASGSYDRANLYWASSFGAAPGAPASQNRPEGGDWSQNPETDASYYGYGNHLTLEVYGDPRIGPVTTTPEPTSLALLGTGFVGLIPLVRRRVRV